MLIGIVFAATLSAAGAPWAIAPVEGINVHEGHVAAAQRVLEGHLEALEQPFVPLKKGADLDGAAREAGAGALLRCTLTRLGQRVKVWMRLQPLEGPARTVALDAGSPEDLDPVLLRLARQLAKGEPDADPRMGEVTEREQDALGRKIATSNLGLAVTGTFGATSGGGDSLGGLSLYLLYDARNFMADIEAGFGISQSSSGSGDWTGLSVAGLLPLSDRQFTPFVGAGLGFLRLGLDGRSGTGVEIFGDAGVLFGRTSTVHFRADVKPFVTTFQLTDDARHGAVAYGARLALGVGF